MVSRRTTKPGHKVPRVYTLRYTIRKKNLVTQKKGDQWECELCGHTWWSQLRTSAVCPKCHRSSIIEDQFGRAHVPVYGLWTTNSPVCHKCPHCSTNLIEVPKTGHVNSVFWPLKRERDEVLACCPNGCPE